MHADRSRGLRDDSASSAGELEFGVIAEGKRADLLLVEGDPTVELRALSNIRAVVKNGLVLDRLPI